MVLGEQRYRPSSSIDDGLGNRLGLLQATSQTPILAVKLFIFLDQRVLPEGFAVPFPGLECCDGAIITLPSPVSQMRGIEPFPAQEGADLAGIAQSVNFLQNAQLICGREPTPYWFY